MFRQISITQPDDILVSIAQFSCNVNNHRYRYVFIHVCKAAQFHEWLNGCWVSFISLISHLQVCHNPWAVFRVIVFFFFIGFFLSHGSRRSTEICIDFQWAFQIRPYIYFFFCGAFRLNSETISIYIPSLSIHNTQRKFQVVLKIVCACSTQDMFIQQSIMLVFLMVTCLDL